jgi:hypothetical protein
MIRFDDAWGWDGEKIAVVGEAENSDGVRYVCLVRGEALDAAYGSAPDEGSRMAAFREHRAEIEARLIRRIGEGHVERPASQHAPWQVVLLASDLG